jgi:hypothetical protein
MDKSPIRDLTIKLMLAGTLRGFGPTKVRRAPQLPERRIATSQPRPIGTTWQEQLPGSPLDSRSKGHVATWEVVAHVRDGEGKVVEELCRRTRLERAA